MGIQAKEITLVDISKLKHYSLNRNKHPKEQIERLAKLIEEHGMRDPLTVDKDTMEVITGNGTLMACKKLKMKEVPVVFQTFESDEQRYAFSVSHNAINNWAEIDLSNIHKDLEDMNAFDLDLLGIKNFQFEPVTELPPGDEDEIPERVEPKTKLGDLYILGNHRLLCGDSTNIQHVEKLMNGEKADMVFTDPPYGIDIEKYANDKRLDTRKLSDGRSLKRNTYRTVNWDSEAFDPRIILSHFSDCDEIFIWGANNVAHLLPDGTNHSWVCWDKRTTEDSAKIRGSDFELCWSKHLHAFKIIKSVWYGPFGHIKKDDGFNRVHPTQKPVKLFEKICELWGNGKTKIVDLFGGSGSTLIACEKTKRKCFMMELDPHYCDVIVARWEKYTGKKAQLQM